MPTRKDFEEEMGESYSRPEKMIAGVRKAGKKAFGEDEEGSYEADFDAAVSESSIEAMLDELKTKYKKAKSKEEKMKIIDAQTRLRAKLFEIKGK